MTSYVYIIQSGNEKNPPIKIGVANDPSKRVAELQTGNPFTLRVLAKIKCDSKMAAHNLESWLHKRFSHKRINGEWFWSEGCDLKKAFGVWNHIKNANLDFKKCGNERLFGSKHASEMESLRQSHAALKSRNARLKLDNKRLIKDMEEYLDSMQCE